MTFQHEIYRGETPVPVIVTARVYRDGDAYGSLSCSPAWYCDVTRVREIATKEDITDSLTTFELDTIRDVAVSTVN